MAKSSMLLPVAAGGAALLLLSSSKKKKKSGKPAGRTRWGVRISNDCQTVDIVDPKLFERFTYGAFNELVDADKSLTLLQMSYALFGDIVEDKCSGFPERPESSDIAELFTVVMRRVAQYMIEDDRIKAGAGQLMDDETLEHFTQWYRAWRNYPSSDVPAVTAGHVSFASDYSDYQISPEWKKETVLPFVKGAVEDGADDISSIFESFKERIGVMVGKFIYPISELPTDKASVKGFLLKAQQAIKDAAASLGG